jgi:hypothetical protein
MQDKEIDGGFRYDAFITGDYSSPDEGIAEHLRRDLEKYRAPRSLRKRGAPGRLNGVFLDREGIPSSSELGGDIAWVLQQSRFLIVVCSPRTPGSERVAKQIEAFRESGRADKVLALLIEGEPEQSFPSLLREERQLTIEIDGERREWLDVIEPLAADIRAPSLSQSLRLLKTEKLRLIAPIIGCSFDDLKRRQRERLVRYWGAVAAIAIAASSVFGTVSFMQWRNAVEQERIAAEQKRQAEEAYVNLTRELPERFKDVPQALPAIKKLLEENASLLEQMQREGEDPLQFVDDLLTRDRSPNEDPFGGE